MKARKRMGKVSRVTVSAGHDGRARMVQAVVEDPYDRSRLSVEFRAATDVLREWLARGYITDAEKAAGDALCAIYETAQIGAGMSSSGDLSAPYVDGGYPQDPLTDARMIASEKLIAVKRVIGQPAYRWTESVVCLGETVSVLAERVGIEARVVSHVIRLGLKELAASRGTTGRPRGKINGFRVDGVGS